MFCQCSGGCGFKRHILMQVITAEALAMVQFTILSSAAFGGVFIEQITSEDADLTLTLTLTQTQTQTLTQTQVSWVISVLFIGNLVGNVLSSVLNPRLGAVLVLRLCAPVAAAGWLLLAFGEDFWTLLCGRALNGLAIGTAFGPAVTYLGEIASAEIRGVLTTLMMVNGCVGMFTMYLSGWLLGWRNACLVVGIGPMAVLLMAMLVVPRSAKWIVSKGYPVEEAERSLRFFQGNSYDVNKGLDEIRRSLGDEHNHNASFLEVLRLLKLRQYRIPIYIVLGVYTFLAFSGGLVISSFAPVVFTDVGGFHSPYIGSLLLTALRLVFAIISSFAVDKLQRGTLLMLNGAGGAAGCLVAGVFFYFGRQLAGFEWVSLAAVLVVVCSMTLGVAPLGIVLLSELIPNAVRAELGGLCMLYHGASQFIVAYLFPLAADSLGMATLFWIFAAVHVAMFVFAKFCVPDTKGKSIEEIQLMFEKRVSDSGTIVRTLEENTGR